MEVAAFATCPHPVVASKSTKTTNDVHVERVVVL